MQTVFATRPRLASTSLFVFPELTDLAPALPEVETLAAEPSTDGGILFTEAEVTRMAAAIHARATRDAHQAALATLEAALTDSTASFARQVQVLVETRDREGAVLAGSVKRLFALFAETCLGIVADAGLCQAMQRAADHVLADLPARTKVQVEVAPDLVDRMTALLAPHAGAHPTLDLEIRGRRDLPPGEIAMSWQDGWAEWSFDRLREDFLRRLAQIATERPGAAADRPSSPDMPPSDRQVAE